MIGMHELVAVDAAGELCACGVKGDYLEHLADVAVFLMGTTKPATPHSLWCTVDGCERVWYTAGMCQSHFKRQAREGVMEPTDEQWADDQQRRHNLASFSKSAPERVRKPKRFRPTLEQMAIAERVMEAA